MPHSISSLVKRKTPLSRREFLQAAALTLGGLGLRPWRRLFTLPDFPQADRLGRVFTRIDVKARPDYNSETVGALYDDAVVPWLHEIAGSHPYRFKQRWVEIPEGYVWASDLQPVRNLPNQPTTILPVTSLGQGMWVEVTVPYVDIVLDKTAIAPWLKYRIENDLPPRLYYSQILWVDQIKMDENNQVWYRLNERYGYGDIFWAVAEAFRPLTEDEIAPINPDAADKRVVVNVYEKFQTLSCYEGATEVYFCPVSAGKKFDPDGNPLETSSTPLGKNHHIWRKQISTHMSGGTTGGGYDLPGIGWTTLFVGTGVAIHSTFWHNNFGGELMSHGCVNCRPDDAKWVFRWTSPAVPYDPGDVTISGMTSTPIDVVEG